MKKFCKKIIGFILAKFKKKMSNIELLKRHAKTMNSFFSWLIVILEKGDFEDIKIVSKQDKYFDFSIAGERFVVKAEMNNSIGTKFTVFFNYINPDSYPTRKLEHLKTFDFVSEKGDDFIFMPIQFDSYNTHLKINDFSKLFLSNLIGYLSSQNKSNYQLIFQI